MNKALKTAQNDFKEGIKEIRNYFENEGIKEDVRKKIVDTINLADGKLNGLAINDKKLLYFSDLIKTRGN